MPTSKGQKFQSKSSIWKPKSKSLALIALAKKSARYSNQGDFDIVQRKEKVDLNQQKNFGKIYLYLKTSQKFLSKPKVPESADQKTAKIQQKTPKSSKQKAPNKKRQKEPTKNLNNLQIRKLKKC